MMVRTVALATSVLLVLACGGLADPEGKQKDVFPEPGARCQKNVKQITYWQGEYPMPVLAVTEPVTMMVRQDPCDGHAVLECEVPVGLYHPWAPPESPGKAFATLVQQQDYRVLKEVALKNNDGTMTWDLKPDDVVRVTAYYAEGVCALKFGDEEMDGDCPQLSEDTYISTNPDTELPPDLQLVQLACGDVLGWLDVDESIFGRTGFARGVVTEYGKVGPPGAPDLFAQ